MIVDQMSPAAEKAVSTKIQILHKYGVKSEDLNSIYDLIFAKPGYDVFSYYGMSNQDKEDLIEAVYTIFMELNGEAMIA